MPIGTCDHNEYQCNKSECLKYWVNYRHIYLNTKDTEAVMNVVKHNKTATLYYWAAIKLEGYAMHAIKLPMTTKMLFAYTKTAPIDTLTAKGI